jgi:hypothetical protein
MLGPKRILQHVEKGMYELSGEHEILNIIEGV